jgi:hypothetical protein
MWSLRGKAVGEYFHALKSPEFEHGSVDPLSKAVGKFIDTMCTQNDATRDGSTS